MKNNNFWEKLKNKQRPILALAPMAGFTDSAFRQICHKFGADVLYSEMVSATALNYFNQTLNRKTSNNRTANNKTAISKTRTRDSGGEATWEMAGFNRRLEKNYVVQLFGANPEHFATAAILIEKKLKPAGIDINCGCPAGKVLKQGAGADLMKDLNKSRQIIEAVLKNTTLPVSIKIRAKVGEVSAIDFLKNISDLPVAAVMIHGRSLSQGFSGDSDFAIVKKARPYFKGVILINGGINTLEDAQRALKESGADGLGLARGILGRPWLFQEIKENKIINKNNKQVFHFILQHARLVEKIKGPGALIELRKHLVWYVSGFPGASRLRAQLVTVKSLADLENILTKEIKK